MKNSNRSDKTEKQKIGRASTRMTKPSGPSVKSMIYGSGVSGSVPDEVWYEAMEQS